MYDSIRSEPVSAALRHAVSDYAAARGPSATVKELAKWLLGFAGGLSTKTLSVEIEGVGRVEVTLNPAVVQYLGALPTTKAIGLGDKT
jgi:hypothetical protein